uniref:immunoglobulin-like domain-containing protein n=1 Tax=Aliarcobacter butzleri TaxID=28197 RepID=UPI00299F8547
MAQVGIVKTLEGGVFYAKDSSGNIRELSIGDSISENEVVYGDSSNQTSAKVEMELSGNDIIVLNQAQQQLIDSSLNQVTFGNEEVIFSKGDINTTFENADLSAWNNTTNDVSDDMETAAGDPTQQETQAGEEEPTEEGRVTARFSARDGSSTDVRSDLRDTIDFGTQLSEGDNDDEIAAELLNPQATTTEPTTPTIPVDTRVAASAITLNNLTVDEGKDITITATVDNAPQTDLVITLNNGEKITIKAGETTGSITFTNPNAEDVYLDNSTETYTIVGTDGGNYVSLDTTDTSIVKVTDTENEVKVTLVAPSDVTEGTDTVTFTVKVESGIALTEPLVVTLSDKQTVTIPAGQTEATVTVNVNNGEDVYKDGSKVELAITKAETAGKEFEKLTVDTDVKTVNVTDTENEVKVTLVAPSDVTEGTDTVTFTVKVESGIALTEPLVVTLSDKQTVTIPAGQTEATVTVNVNNGEDVYKDGSKVELAITKAETAGKEFEKLTVDTDVKTVNVTDTE